MYKSKFKESQITSANQLAEEIQKEIEKIFPNCYVKATWGGNLYSSISVKFMLGKDKSEWSNGIFNNDIANIRFTIDLKGGREIPRDGNIDNQILQMEASSSSFTVNPPEGSYLVYGRVKIPFRKPTGDAQKIIDYTKKYFTTAKKLFQDYQEEMPKELFSLLKGKKF